MKKYTYYGSKKPNQTILYIHGGGHVMGQSDDLPEVLISHLLHPNNALITLDYPLAPQVNVQEITDFITNAINEICLTYNLKSYLIFGRSSGANIMLTLDPSELQLMPKSLISFYGYASLNLDWMTDPIRDLDFNYDHSLLEKYKDDSLVYRRSLDITYPYYFALRKSGCWPEVVGMTKKKILWQHDIPIFVAHSIFDPDVPYHCSTTIRNHFSNNTLLTSTCKQHAFDHKDSEQTILLNALDKFLNSI